MKYDRSVENLEIRQEMRCRSRHPSPCCRCQQAFRDHSFHTETKQTFKLLNSMEGTSAELERELDTWIVVQVCDVPHEPGDASDAEMSSCAMSKANSRMFRCVGAVAVECASDYEEEDNQPRARKEALERRREAVQGESPSSISAPDKHLFRL